MDDIIDKGILFGEFPPKGIYFTVYAAYNDKNPEFKGKIEKGSTLVTDPMHSFPVAVECSELFIKELQNKFGSDTSVTEVDPEDHGGFHAYIVDKTDTPLMGVGIELHDYRGMTVH